VLAQRFNLNVADAWVPEQRSVNQSVGNGEAMREEIIRESRSAKEFNQPGTEQLPLKERLLKTRVREQGVALHS
jgi:hypothetical protein